MWYKASHLKRTAFTPKGPIRPHHKHGRVTTNCCKLYIISASEMWRLWVLRMLFVSFCGRPKDPTTGAGTIWSKVYCRRERKAVKLEILLVTMGYVAEQTLKIFEERALKACCGCSTSHFWATRTKCRAWHLDRACNLWKCVWRLLT